MGVLVTKAGPNGRTMRYELGGSDDPDGAAPVPKAPTRLCEHGNLRRGCAPCLVAGTHVPPRPMPGPGRIAHLPARPAPTRVPGPGIVFGRKEHWPWWLLLAAPAAVAAAVFLQRAATLLWCR